MDKREIRLQMKTAQRLVREIPDEPVYLFWEKFEDSSVFRDAATVLLYMSIPGEVPTSAVVKRWSLTKTVALPLVSEHGLELRKYSPDRLTLGYRGIIEPSADAESVEPACVDLAFVPGVAFCRCGSQVWRLGRGGGYYDRLLPFLHCTKIGVCFDYRVLPNVPVDPWDIPLDDLAVCEI